jgi:hypothetical protein
MLAMSKASSEAPMAVGELCQVSFEAGSLMVARCRFCVFTNGAVSR